MNTKGMEWNQETGVGKTPAASAVRDSDTHLLAGTVTPPLRPLSPLRIRLRLKGTLKSFREIWTR